MTTHRTSITHQQPPTKTAIIYVRTASGAPEDRGDVYPQRDACRGHCKQLGLTVKREFMDCAQSGLTLDRPGMHALLRYIASHRIDYVVAADRLRISRRFAQQDTVFAAIRAAGAKLETIADDDPELDCPLDVQALVASWNLPVAGYGLHQSHQRLGQDRVTRRHLQKSHRVIQRGTKRLVHAPHLLLRQQAAPVQRLKLLPQQHREQHDVLLAGRQELKLLIHHSRSIVSRLLQRTKHRAEDGTRACP